MLQRCTELISSDISWVLVQAEQTISTSQLVDTRWLAWAEQLAAGSAGEDAEAPAVPSPSRKPPVPTSSALDSGMLDMSAFGMAAELHPRAAPPQPPPQQQPSAVDTGMLDMSAFDVAPEPPPQQQPQPAQQQASTAAQLESGQLDMSAFGLVPPPPQLPRVATLPGPAPSSALESCQLDMSAFGSAGFAQTGASSSRDASAATAAEQPPTPGRASEPCRGHSAASSAASAAQQADLGPIRQALPAQHSTAIGPKPLPEAAPLTEAELAALQRLLGMCEAAGGRKQKQEAGHRADTSAFSLLRLDAPETAMRDASKTDEDTAAANGHANGNQDADDAAASNLTGPCLPGLIRPDSLRVLQLAQLAAEAAAGSAGGTAAQFVSGGGGGGSSVRSGGGQAAALDAAARRAVLALQLGTLQNGVAQEQQHHQLQVGAHCSQSCMSLNASGAVATEHNIHHCQRVSESSVGCKPSVGAALTHFVCVSLQATWLASCGLLPGCGGDALLWAAESGAQAALLDSLLALVRPLDA